MIKLFNKSIIKFCCLLFIILFLNTELIEGFSSDLNTPLSTYNKVNNNNLDNNDLNISFLNINYEDGTLSFFDDYSIIKKKMVYISDENKEFMSIKQEFAFRDNDKKADNTFYLKMNLKLEQDVIYLLDEDDIQEIYGNTDNIKLQIDDGKLYLLNNQSDSSILTIVYQKNLDKLKITTLFNIEGIAAGSFDGNPLLSNLLIIRALDEDNGALINNLIIKGETNKKYHVFHKDHLLKIKGYHLNKENTSLNNHSYYQQKPTVLTYKYHKKQCDCHITIKYVDEENNKLHEDIIIDENNFNGLNLSNYQLDIANYLIDIEKSPHDIKMIEDISKNKTFTFVYHKILLMNNDDNESDNINDEKIMLPLTGNHDLEMILLIIISFSMNLAMLKQIHNNIKELS
ncbi:MAG: MucBP domain-containing protein [Bacilli bacterium]|nr:MucBP domain-containing protein [Bacilli bacterium]